MEIPEGTQVQEFIGPQLPKEKTLSPMENLAIFSEKARAEMQQFASFECSKRDGLFDWYKQSKALKDVKEEALRLQARNSKGIGQLPGRVFQDLAYALIADRELKLGSNIIVLTPEDTFEFYRTLYPEKPVMKHEFSISSILGVSVPDCLIVKKTDAGYKVVGLLEITRKKMEQRSKFHKKRHLDEVSEKYSEIFQNAETIWINPSTHRQIVDSSGGRIRVPFHDEDFKSLVDGILSETKPAEIQGKTIPTPVPDATLS